MKLAIILLISSINILCSQYTFKAVIRDEFRRPVVGAEATIESQNLSAESDYYGNLIIQNINVPKFTITITHQGFKTIVSDIQLSDEDIVHVYRMRYDDVLIDSINVVMDNIRDKEYVDINEKYWKISFVDTTCWLNQVFFLDTANGWLIGGKGFLYNNIIGSSKGLVWKTTSSGESWILQAKLDIDILKPVYFINKDTGFVCSSRKLLKTINGGENWLEVYKDGGFGIEIFKFKNANVGYLKINYAVPKSGSFVGRTKIVKTTDGGLNWNERTWTVEDSKIFVTNEPSNNNKRLFKFSDNILKISDNYGYSWDILYPPSLSSVCFLKNGQVFAISIGRMYLLKLNLQVK